MKGILLFLMVSILFSASSCAPNAEGGVSQKDKAEGKIFSFPELAGENYEAVINNTDYKRDFTIKKKTEEFSDKYEEGIIISQDVTAGTKVPQKKEINVVVSAGVKTAKVPDVYGLTQKAAETLLTEAKFVFKIEVQSSSTVPEGQVIETAPKKDQVVAYGSTVIIIISSGKKVDDVAVPNVLTKTKTDAENLIKAAGLKVTSVEEYHDTAAQGTVFEQSMDGGDMAPSGSTITIKISKGPAPEEPGGG